MVLHKRLEYGFNGYQVPPTPRAPRSTTKRVSSRKKNDDHNRMCAFDLLATVARNLLLEDDNSAEKLDRVEISASEANKSFFVSEIISKASGSTVSDRSRKFPSAPRSVNSESTMPKKATTEAPNNGKPCGFENEDRNVNLVIRDDVENSCGCTQPQTLNNKTFRPPARIGDRRIRRLSASNQWKCAPKRNNDCKKTCYKHHRSLRDYPFKKRKLYRLENPSGSHERSSSPRKGSIEEGSGLVAAQDWDSHVKLKIKSFRVPEFFIEIPETATVSSLKRMVMEAVTAIFSGELHVGVMLQGKRIRDDNKTLLQTGICHDNKIDALGFSLEPEDRFVEPPLEVSDVLQDSRALVPVPAMNAVVPTRKSKRAEVAQRRIRCPFTVSEVEALVEAVEKLGTGRWRDVKFRAFNDAKHRTYVDLKDKWKTLVHTARISPQQRRGEPVPQGLLDRVLTAHGYWFHHQANNQLKHQLWTEIC